MEQMMSAPATGEQAAKPNTPQQAAQQPALKPTQQGENGIGNPSPTGENADKAEGQPEKTFTQAELDAIVQKRIADVKRTAEQRSLMTLTEREAELSKREQAILYKELELSATAVLKEKNLPPELVSVISLTTEEALPEQLAAIETIFNTALEKRVTQQLRGTPPQSGGKPIALDPVDDAFQKGLHGELVTGSKLNINGKSVK